MHGDRAYTFPEESSAASYRSDCELLDGILVKRTGAELEHALIHASVGAWFGQREREWNIRAVMSYSIRVSKDRIRIADLCIVPNDGANEKIRETPPLLCIEVLSPEDSSTDLSARLNDYVEMGVPNLWLLDPSDRSAMIYTNGGLMLFKGDRLTIENSPIYLDLPEIFSALD